MLKIKYVFLAVMVSTIICPPLFAGAAEKNPALMEELTGQCGFSGNEAQSLIFYVETAEKEGLPSEAITNAIRQGAARKAGNKVIEAVLKEKLGKLREASSLLKEMAENGETVPAKDRTYALNFISELLERGLTAGELKELSVSSSCHGFGREYALRAGECAARLKEAEFSPGLSREIMSTMMEGKTGHNDLKRITRAAVRAKRMSVPEEEIKKAVLSALGNKEDIDSLEEKLGALCNGGCEGRGEKKRIRAGNGQGRGKGGSDQGDKSGQ